MSSGGGFYLKISEYLFKNHILVYILFPVAFYFSNQILELNRIKNFILFLLLLFIEIDGYFFMESYDPLFYMLFFILFDLNINKNLDINLNKRIIYIFIFQIFLLFSKFYQINFINDFQISLINEDFFFFFDYLPHFNKQFICKRYLFIM